jgi:hypothetical protein
MGRSARNVVGQVRVPLANFPFGGTLRAVRRILWEGTSREAEPKAKKELETYGKN